MITPFEATVAELAETHGVEVKVKIGAMPGGFAAGSTIQYHPVMISEPVDVQRWVAAHEVAHIVLKHTGFLKRSAVGLVVVVVAWLVVFVFGSVVESRQLVASSLWVVVVGLLAVICGGRILTRRDEREADALACGWGYHITPTVKAWMMRSQSLVTQSWWYQPFALHDQPRQRASRCAHHGH